MHILWRRMYSTSSRLAWAHTSGSSHPPFVVIPMPSFPHAEQFLLIMMHESAHFILHVANPLFLSFFMNNPACPLRIFHLPLMFTPSPAPAGHLSTAPPLLEQLGEPHDPVRSLVSIVLAALTCRCMLPHLLCNCTSTRLAYVGKPWSSFVARGQPEHAQIRHCFSYPRCGRDLRHAPQLVLSAICAPYNSHRNSADPCQTQ